MGILGGQIESFDLRDLVGARICRRCGARFSITQYSGKAKYCLDCRGVLIEQKEARFFADRAALRKEVTKQIQ